MKLAGRPVLCRLAQLDRMVRSGTYPNARSAARELEVSVRTVKRNFDLLRDSWGAPLEDAARALQFVRFESWLGDMQNQEPRNTFVPGHMRDGGSSLSYKTTLKTSCCRSWPLL